MVCAVDQFMVRLIVVGEQAAIAALYAVRLWLFREKRGLCGSHCSIDVLIMHELERRFGYMRDYLWVVRQPPEHTGSSGEASSSPSTRLPVQRPVAGSIANPKILFSLRRRSPLFSRLTVAPGA